MLVELVIWVDNYKVNTVSAQPSERLLRIQYKSDILIYIIKINRTSTVGFFSPSVVVLIQFKQTQLKICPK